MPAIRERKARFARRGSSAGLSLTLVVMPRKRLTLDDLVAAGTFNPRNFRPRRALDESGPLEDPELEETRRVLMSYRRVGDIAGFSPLLQEFARQVAER
jgi:hypothetical protein